MAEIDAKHFVEIFREAQGDRSLSDLARETGLSRQQLHRYFQGSAVPRADAFLKLCSALSLDPKIFMEGQSSADTDGEYEALAAYAKASQAPDDILPDGYYHLNVLPLVRDDLVARHLVIIFTEDGKRRFIQRTPRWSYSGLPPTKPERQYKGEVRYLNNGLFMFATGTGFSEPEKNLKPNISFFVSPSAAGSQYLGLNLSTTNYPILPPNGKRQFLEYLGADKSATKLFRQCGVFPFEKVPKTVVNFLTNPERSRAVIMAQRH